jgi:hypothetical protein
MHAKLALAYLLALLAVVANSKWSKPFELAGQEEHIKDYSAYLDQSTLETHVMYCSEKTDTKGNTYQALEYLSFNESNEVNHKSMMSAVHGCRSVKIMGTNNGKNLYVVMEGQRTHQLAVCNETYTSACYDVYFTESSTGGEQWSDLVPVSRVNLNDAVDRMAPRIILTDSGRLFIFYIRTVMANAVQRLAYTSRPPASTVFVLEAGTQLSPGERFIGHTTTLVNGKTQMHFFFDRGMVVKDAYTFNGLTWTESTVTNKDLHFSSFIANSTATPNQIFGIYSDDKTSNILITDDNGNNWGREFKLLSKYHRVSAATISSQDPSGGSPLAHILTTSFMQTNLTYTTVNLKSGEARNVDPPFAEYQTYGLFMPQLRWYFATASHKIAIKAFAYVWEQPDRPRLYVSTNEDL